MTGLREKDTIALGDNLEVTLAGLGRGGRRSLLFLLLEDLEYVSMTHRGKRQKNTHLLENLHLGLGLTIFALLGLGLSHTVTNADQLSVDIFQARSDAVLDRLLGSAS
jgi:hypothetical protein